MFRVWWPLGSSSMQILILGLRIIVISPLTSPAPSNKEFPIDETSGHFSATAARHYANCSNDHRFMDSQQMYTYKLAAEAWHHLLQLDGSPLDPPPSGTSTVEIPTIIDKPNTHCPLQSDCASLLASLMYSVAQTPAQPAIPPPPRFQTHEVRALDLAMNSGHARNKASL